MPLGSPEGAPEPYQGVIEKTSMITGPEAKIKIYETIVDVLVSIGADDDMSDDDVEELAEEMSELTDILLETLGLEVNSVEADGSIKVTLRLYEGEDGESAA